jgi:hypothetical protein
LSTFIENSEDVLLKQLFKTVNTKNFEIIMQELDNFAKFAGVFSADQSFVDRIVQTSEKLKGSLIEAVQQLHPEHVFTIPEERSTSCFKFLDEYLSNKGEVYTTNYDLLLYWVLMRNKVQQANDGFGKELLNQSDEYVSDWEPEYASELTWGENKDNQSVFYLHGALPIFDTGIDIIKEIYGGNYLLENIKKRMNQKHYPIFVTAGNAEEKLRHITHNQYLTFCYDKLCSIKGSLITFGFCFGDNDIHIIDAINQAHKQPKEGRLWSIYIGVYSDTDLQHIEDIKDKFKCKVNIWNAKTAHIWN